MTTEESREKFLKCTDAKRRYLDRLFWDAYQDLFTKPSGMGSEGIQTRREQPAQLSRAAQDDDSGGT